MKETYKDIGTRIGQLVDDKNAQYGDSINSTAEFLRLLFPNGITPDHFAHVGIMVRIWDKVKRVAAGNKGNENAYEDIAGYGILMSQSHPVTSQGHDFSNLRCGELSKENLEAAMYRIQGYSERDAQIKKISEAIASIRNNYPSSGYTMLCEGLDVALELLEKELANVKRIQYGDTED
jgi:hypothetical protein